MYLLTRRGGQAAAGEWRLEAAGVPDVPEAHGSAWRAGDGAARQLCHHGCLRPVGRVHMAVAATTVTCQLYSCSILNLVYLLDIAV